MEEEGEGRFNDRITNILIKLKINPGMMGFDFIRSAIKFCLGDKELINNVTKVYPLVAKEYDVKPSLVERCIRNSISTSFNIKGLLAVNDFYDTVVYSNDFKISNSELIALIVEKVKMDILKEKLFDIIEKENQATMFYDID